MRWVLSVIVILLVTSLFAPQAHAIIFLPAIALIPIAKIVALIIASFSFPALAIGALWSKLFGKSLGRTISVIIAILVVLAIILAIFFKLHNPDRPLF